jgi:hypothetical protein
LRLLWINLRDNFYLSNLSQALIMSPEYLLEKSIKINMHFHHPVKFIITYFTCSLINCMVSQVVVGGPHTISPYHTPYHHITHHTTHHSTHYITLHITIPHIISLYRIPYHHTTHHTTIPHTISHSISPYHTPYHYIAYHITIQHTISPYHHITIPHTISNH